MKHPPFCPNRDCPNYHKPVKSWYVKNGFFTSYRSGPVQRYKCRVCGRGFSSETFSIDYFTKLKLPYKIIMDHLITASGIRDLSRLLKVSCSTITNRIARLARQSMAIHAELCSDLSLKEDLVADGFESFTRSQYFPNNIQLLIAKESQFWLVSDYAHLRRKGRMTALQKKRNETMKVYASINNVTVYRSFTNIVNTALALESHSDKDSITLYTDEHSQYKRVMDLLSEKERSRLKHVRISSKKARTLSNPLFAVNYADREIRKDCSDHTRQTVQWAKNTANAMDRLAIYRTHHNFLKPYRINGNTWQQKTHAGMAGILRTRIQKEMKTIFTQRRFLGKATGLVPADLKLWCRCLSTPMNRFADYLPRFVLQ